MSEAPNADDGANQVRAGVFLAPGEPVKLQYFRRPELAEGETLVQVDCCTLCGSDLHSYLGKRSGPTPSILGHEAVGRITEFGPKHAMRDWRGEPLAIGDRVSWAVAASCGHCFFCRRELPQKCTRLFKYGHESCRSEHPLSGGLAELCHLSVGSAIVRVPAEIPDVVAASANCAAATAAAAHRAAGGCQGKTTLIQGAGLLGLVTAAMAQGGGAAHVIVADVDPTRLAMAKRFGATVTVDVAEAADQLDREVEQATDGRGVDVAFEMSGAAAAVRQGLGLLRTGGCYVLVGAVRPVGAIPLDIEQVVRRMWRLQGLHNYAPADLVAAIDFLASHHRRFPFGELVSGVFPLEEINAAFGRMLHDRAVRVAVRPQRA